MAVYLSIGCPPELAVEVLDVKVYLSIERRVAVNENR
jgi:hypothetical protein